MRKRLILCVSAAALALGGVAAAQDGSPGRDAWAWLEGADGWKGAMRVSEDGGAKLVVGCLTTAVMDLSVETATPLTIEDKIAVRWRFDAAPIRVEPWKVKPDRATLEPTMAPAEFLEQMTYSRWLAVEVMGRPYVFDLKDAAKVKRALPCGSLAG